MYSKFTKFVSVLLAAILIFSVLPISQIKAEASDETDNINAPIDETKLEDALNEELADQNISVNEVDFSNEDDIVTIETETTDEEIGSVQARFEIEPGADNFSVFITEGNVEKEYNVELTELSSDVVEGDFTDVETGETYDLDSTEGQASFVFLIPVGIVMTEAALTALYATGAMIIVSGAAYVVANKAKKSKKYNHFKATVKGGSVYIGAGMSRSKAVSWFKSKHDVYSVSKNQAKEVAAAANRSGKPYHEVDQRYGKNRKGHYWHWHAYKKKPTDKHSFYGSPVK
ncbi:hypothetical protein GZ22_16665 [Terribacillus saccharophilus]|uniref:Uncharacterized protein n=1 Tax=Terribacillus saccharophilus TaxID=361277 RepID=A0A075LPT5_9BACI|nr:SAR2788 family putative toxin [Terribacillus goriensis]AIF68106.1 hypothetical protein GZ22_16665 [Terribacillus goriensis]